MDGMRINHKNANQKQPEIKPADKIDDNLFYVGMNESGNLVYLLKEGTKRELYFVIDLSNRHIYDKCFNDAAARVKNPEFKAERDAVLAKHQAPKLLGPDEAVKRLDRAINNLKQSN